MAQQETPPAVQKTWVWSLGQEDPLEKEMATHSSILAWRIPWAKEPGRATVHKEWDITEPTEQAHSLCHMENEYIYLTLIYWDLYVSSSEVKKTNKNPSLQKKQNKMKRQSTE